MTTRINSSGTTSYVFDDRGLMTAATMADGTSITYSYDALGNRRAKTVNGVITNYLTAPIFGMSHVLAELASDMSIKATYVYAGPQLLKEEPSATDRSQDLYMLHEGKVGSITHTVDMNGSVRNEYDYDTFGTRTHLKTANTGSNQHFGYTGEMYGAESGLLYLRARYYDPSIGRFISADPYLGRMAEPVTQNRYIYVHNNPLLFVDPLGNDATDYVDGINSVGAGVVDYLAYNADMVGLSGEKRQNEVWGYIGVYQHISDQIIANPGAARDAATRAITEGYADNPDFVRGRSLVGPSLNLLLRPAGTASLYSLSVVGMAANGDALRAIENGANTVDEFVQAVLLGDPLGGMCTK